MALPERRLVITETAQDDYLDILKQSVRQWGRDQAAQYKGMLDASMERLLEFPGLGLPATDLLDGCHRLRARHHGIYYTFTDNAVLILRILHERQHVTPELLMPEPGE